jgi:hypothetical protein
LSNGQGELGLLIGTIGVLGLIGLPAVVSRLRSAKPQPSDCSCRLPPKVKLLIDTVPLEMVTDCLAISCRQWDRWDGRLDPAWVRRAAGIPGKN